MGDIVVRSATLADAEACAEIYAPYARETVVTFEAADAPSDADELRERMRRTLEHFPWIVAERDGRVCGFSYAHALRERAAYAHSVEVTIYVEKAQRGAGCGRALYAELERLLAEQGIRNLYACVATTEREGDPNLTDASPRFHEKMGYAPVGTFHRCGFKFGRFYDVTWMEKLLDEK